MKRIGIHLIALALAAASCSSGGPDQLRAEKQRYQNKIEEFNQKIEEIDQQLGEMESVAEEDAVAVEVKELQPESFSRYFEVNGIMEAVRDAFISPEINGQIREIPVNRGQRVREGDVLIRLNTEVTEKNIQEVETSLELATRVFEKQEDLWEQNIGSEIQYLEARNNKESLEARLATLEKQLDLARITAPFSGIVDQIMVKEGELASPGMQLVRLVNLSSMRVAARISESYLNSVKEGDPVELSFASYPGLKITAPVYRLGRVIDPQTRTIVLEVLLENRDGKLIPNMLTAVRIRDFSVDNALVVPSIILREDFNGTFLYRVAEENGTSRAEKVYVETGQTVQDRTMIPGGLDAGDRIIVKGYNLVSNGSSLRIVNS